MSNLIKFELNRAGVRELMQSQAMQNVLVEYARHVSDNAGEGYEPYIGATRANVSVRITTNEAYQDNLDNNTMEKALRS